MTAALPSPIFRNLKAFLAELRRRGDLVEIEAPVDAHLEIAEIHRRVIAAKGPALLFKNVKGKAFPVVTNLFGTKDRVDLAFGIRPKELIRRIASLPEALLPPSVGRLWRQRDLAVDALKIGFKKCRRAPVLTHQIDGANPLALPALTSWSEDGGPFLTLPLVHTAHPGPDSAHGRKPDNLGMYRIQLHDERETGMHFQIGKGGGFHLFEAERQNLPLKANIYLGGPPALTLAAIAPLPENVPESLLSSLLLGERLGRTAVGGGNPDVVSEAEFCLVGEVPPKVRRAEGPFGDHYGYYSLKHDFPVFRPRAIYHREGAIFPATIVGKPRQEDFFLGDYLQELLSPLFPLAMPAVKDLWSYGETGYHSLAAAVLKERYGREALSAVFRVLGEGQLTLTKFLLGVDQPIDLRDFKTVLTHVLERVEWENDLIIFDGTAMDTLDYAGPALNKGSKGAILGLGEKKRDLPRDFRGDVPAALARKVAVYAPGTLVVEVPGYADDRGAAARLAKEPAFRGWQLIVAVDDAAKAVKTDQAFLWTAFTRFEPAADLYARDTVVERHRLRYQGPITLDARMKPWYPKELFCDQDTARLVDRRWTEYFPGKNVAMGSSDEGNLYS